MWAERRWIGRYIPPGTQPGRELAAYATWCTAVEGNTTFYGLPSPATVERWTADSPTDFRFLFKLPRTITHDRRLRNAGPDLAAFLDRLEPLGPRASPVSIQLPASFGPDDLGVLARFVAGLPADWRWAVEVRDRRWCEGGPVERELNDLLAANGVERIIIDTRAVFATVPVTPAEHEAHRNKPRLPVRPVAIGPSPVVRFIGRTDVAENPAWWAKWVPKVAQWLQEGRSPLVFIHTPDNVVAPALARAFHAEVQALVPDLAPLPDPVRPAAQLSLVDRVAGDPGRP